MGKGIECLCREWLKWLIMKFNLGKEGGEEIMKVRDIE